MFIHEIVQLLLFALIFDNRNRDGVSENAKETHDRYEKYLNYVLQPFEEVNFVVIPTERKESPWIKRYSLEFYKIDLFSNLYKNYSCSKFFSAAPWSQFENIFSKSHEREALMQ